MSLSSGTIKRDIDLLNSDQLQQIANFIAFLMFYDERQRTILDPEQLALLANEFADKDRVEEEGIDDYAAMLAHEDLSLNLSKVLNTRTVRSFGR